MRFWLHLVIAMLVCTLTEGCNRCKNSCVNGVCIQRVCSCDLWYEGDFCDRSVLAVHEATYAGVAIINGVPEQVSFELALQALPNQMLLDGLELAIQFTSNTRFDVPEQEWHGSTYTGEGEMLIDGISLRLDEGAQPQSGQVRIEAQRQE